MRIDDKDADFNSYQRANEILQTQTQEVEKEEEKEESKRQKDKPKETEEEKTQKQLVFDPETNQYVEVDVKEIFQDFVVRKNLEKKTAKSKHRQAVEEEKRKQLELLQSLGVRDADVPVYGKQPREEDIPQYDPIELPDGYQLQQLPTIFQGLPQEMQTFAEGGQSGCPQGYYWNGQTCVKLPKNAYVTSDPDEYNRRKQAYTDSLSTHSKGEQNFKNARNFAIDYSPSGDVFLKREGEGFSFQDKETNLIYVPPRGITEFKDLGVKNPKTTLKPNKVTEVTVSSHFDYPEYKIAKINRYKKPTQPIIFQEQQTPPQPPKEEVILTPLPIRTPEPLRPSNLQLAPAPETDQPQPPTWSQHLPSTFRALVSPKYQGKLQNQRQVNPIAQMVRNVSGFQPLDQEQHVDVEGQIKPQGYSSLQDIFVQKKYKEDYAKYEEEMKQKEMFAELAKAYGKLFSSR